MGARLHNVIDLPAIQHTLAKVRVLEVARLLDPYCSSTKRHRAARYTQLNIASVAQAAKNADHMSRKVFEGPSRPLKVPRLQNGRVGFSKARLMGEKHVTYLLRLRKLYASQSLLEL